MAKKVENKKKKKQKQPSGCGFALVMLALLSLFVAVAYWKPTINVPETLQKPVEEWTDRAEEQWEKLRDLLSERFSALTELVPGKDAGFREETAETPEEAAVRELSEECGLVGTVVRPLNVLHRSNGNTEYVFLVDVLEEQEPIVGSDPEIAEGEEQAIKAVCWKTLSELSEKDRAFLWSYGLMDVEGFREVVLGWGDEVSYPGM